MLDSSMGDDEQDKSKGYSFHSLLSIYETRLLHDVKTAFDKKRRGEACLARKKQKTDCGS
jgi:hypothetical protein